MKCRDRAQPLLALSELTPTQHAELREYGKANKNAWSPLKGAPSYSLVASFKSEVKSYYFWGQGTLCCYCSSQLQNNARSYDADHILDKNTFAHFTFELANICAACVVCNTHKLKKSVLADPSIDPDCMEALPTESSSYSIVHPHIDEWADHLVFTEDGLVKALNNDPKGKKTIEVCGIEATNFTRLAAKFSGGARQEAYELMCAVISKKRRSKILSMLSILDRLASDSPDAQAVVRGLRQVLEVV